MDSRSLELEGSRIMRGFAGYVDVWAAMWRRRIGHLIKGGHVAAADGSPAGGQLRRLAPLPGARAAAAHSPAPPLRPPFAWRPAAGGESTVRVQ
eukprot:9018132-Pyramimonas_sp.AAC.2